MKILVMTPMQAELDYFSQSCIERGYHAAYSVKGRLTVVQFPELGLTLARGGTGKAQFAVQTQHLLDTSPDWGLVICSGAAGALADELCIGDVVVALTTVEHDYRNKFNPRPVPKFEGAPPVLADLRHVAMLPLSFKVHFGMVASGDEDVVEAERRRALREATRALAVAWEGAGGARACAFSNVPFLEIRGVTDAADKRAPLDFEMNLKVVMHNIATLITAWISRAQQTDRKLATQSPG